ncbi:MAG: L-seryl-tRNA(Ser) seleniumtransferase [Planctomycetota bacterium]|jgi:L-seryl-tRNA(Ser) seleniumtransferase
MASDTQNPYRLLPSVEASLLTPEVAALEADIGRELLQAFVQATLDGWRAEIQAGELDAAGLGQRLEQGGLARAIKAKVQQESGRGVVPAINVSGVVLNTGLGRSPMHPEVAERMAAAAGGYCVLEVDRFSGQRNQRDERLSELLGRLTGAEAGIAVNNNAAAVLLVMHTFAFGREGIVSRGELVEIGGSFRVPDVMRSANAKLVEVGATNRTRIADYASAITTETGLMIKVHPSNFRVVGFTEEVPPGELSALGREHGITSAWDLGSGRIEHGGAGSLDLVGDETEVREAVASGMDVVTFSGDKLFGGPQAGLLVGRKETIAALRKNNMYRAMRLDKVSLAGLEATAELLLRGRGDELPTRALLRATAEEIKPKAETLVRDLSGLDGVQAELVADRSEPGSGSAPDTYLDTYCVKLSGDGFRPGEVAKRLRAGTPPVFARVQADALWLDPRTLLPGQHDALVAAVKAAL